MKGSGGQNVKWNKPGTEGQVPPVLSKLKQKSALWTEEHLQELGRGLEGTEEGKYGNLSL